MGYWNAGTKGTVFMLCGRTEFVEKYGINATDLAKRGYASLAVDWRGQGLADRLAEDPMLGHVGAFQDYQHDLAATIEVAAAAGLPKPWHLLGHSMGGAIGLRALLSDHPFKTAIFSGPMWGIVVPPLMKPFAGALARTLCAMGLAERFAPTTSPESYVAVETFEANKLTTEPAVWDYMQKQVWEVERFGLGGPSVQWVSEALKEVKALAAAPRPDLPVYTAVGALETIVNVPAVADLMATWPGGIYDVIEGARHEIMMEGPAIRDLFFDRAQAVMER